jgi:hypothetical protein
MLIEFAEERGSFASAGSANARFTIAWQSSNFPSTAIVRMFPVSVVICFRWRALTSAMGKSTSTRIPAMPWKALATADPVSPLVAVRMVSSPPSSRTKCPMSRAIMRAAKSLNDAVGPRSSRITWTRS